MEKVYVVTEEKNWKNVEYNDVISIHRTKEKALEMLAECKDNFQSEHKFELKEIRDNYDYEEKDNDLYYTFLDECMGYYYEVAIAIRDLD